MRHRRGPIRIFFDASCLIAAARSPSGGAALVLAECQGTKLVAYSSLEVLQETRRNILGKLGDEEMARLSYWLANFQLRIVEEDGREDQAEWEDKVNPKDRHVVYSSLSAKCQYILTFDRPLIAQVNAASIGVTACLPAEIIHRLIHNADGVD